MSYITADGKYFLDGNLYDMETRENLTEVLRTHARLAMISAVPESQMMIFSPKNPLYTITVFTDVDCAVLPQAAQRNGGTQPLGCARALHVLSAHRAPTRRAGAKPKWCGARRTATKR